MSSRESKPYVELNERSLHLRRLVLRALAGADKRHVGSVADKFRMGNGSYEELMEHYGITDASLAARATSMLQERL